MEPTSISVPLGNSRLTRRDFVKTATTAVAFVAVGNGMEVLAQDAAPPLTNLSRFGPQINCGIIGMGIWGRDILQELVRVGNGGVIAVCDTYPGALKRAAELAPKAPQFQNYKDLLASKDFPAILVATPSHLHRDIVLDALAAGKQVYCEAPLASNLEDARIIAKAAKESNCLFHSGLLYRTDPHRQYIVQFIRSGVLDKIVMVRGQWHSKKSWRAVSPNPEREQALNWRLQKETSPGLIGENGIHAIDFLSACIRARPVVASGFGSVCVYQDGRVIPDTVQLTLEYPKGVRLIYDATLGNSCESYLEVVSGTMGTIMCRKNAALFRKEEDAPLLGWEVYSRKLDYFNQPTIKISLSANPSMSVRVHREAKWQNPDAVFVLPLFYAMDVFRRNAALYHSETTDFLDLYGDGHKSDLKDRIAKLKPTPFPGWKEGYEATVVALKANEAVMTGRRIEFRDEWFEVD